MEKRFIELMKNFEPMQKTVAVAVSGGIDSMALVLLAEIWAKKNGYGIVALTVDHGLRKESKQEAKTVKSWLKKHNIEHHILTNRKKTIPQNNLMEYAREVRYELISKWCKKNKVLELLVAHHAEDQAETFLLRLERGSGVDGLSAMHPESRLHGIRIIRPLLEINKSFLIEYLKSRNQKWIEDPTNYNEKYKRNSLRAALAKISAYEPALTQRINKTAKNMSRARQALEQVAEKYQRESIDFFPSGYAIADLKILRDLPEEITLRILKSTLHRISKTESYLRLDELERLYSKIIGNKNFTGCTLWGCKIMPYKSQNILIMREYAAISKLSSINRGEEIIWDKRFIVSLHKESYITHLNIKILKKSEFSDFFKSLSEIEQKRIAKLIPKDVIETIPFFVTKSNNNSLENIMAVPHINYYRDKKFRRLLSCEAVDSVSKKSSGLSLVHSGNMI